MNATFRTSLVCVLVCLAPAALSAQSADSLPLGARMRVHVTDPVQGNRIEIRGSLMRMAADTLMLSLAGDRGVVTLPRSAVLDVSVSGGRESRLHTLGRIALVAAPAALILGVEAAGPHVPHHSSVAPLATLSALPILLSLHPRESWKPLRGWLER